MLLKTAEQSFTKGLAALKAGQPKKALALFEAAIEIERRHGATQSQPRYLSFYGLCIGMEENHLNEGIRVCRDALTREFYNPDLYWNLGRLQLKAGRRKEAFKTLQSGRRLQPGHFGITGELKRMGVRRRPFLRFLSRANPINVLLGKMTWSETGMGTAVRKDAERVTG
jgi:tetratricopeptide (TPR) repeat protein